MMPYLQATMTATVEVGMIVLCCSEGPVLVVLGFLPAYVTS